MLEELALCLVQHLKVQHRIFKIEVIVEKNSVLLSDWSHIFVAQRGSSINQSVLVSARTASEGCGPWTGTQFVCHVFDGAGTRSSQTVRQVTTGLGPNVTADWTGTTAITQEDRGHAATGSRSSRS